MIASFVFAVMFKIINPDWAWWFELILSVGLTTAVWLTVTFLTPASDMEVLKKFYKKARPGGLGWSPVRKRLEGQTGANESLAPQIGYALMGMTAVYAFLFGVGQTIYGNYLAALILLAVAGVAGYKILSSQIQS